MPLLLLLSTPTTLLAVQDIVSVHRMKLTLTLHRTSESVTEACGTGPASGCAFPPDSNHVINLHAVDPKDWCDLNNIETMGHELLHAIDKHHGTWYTPIWFPPKDVEALRDGDCRFYAERQRKADGR